MLSGAKLEKKIFFGGKLLRRGVEVFLPKTSCVPKESTIAKMVAIFSWGYFFVRLDLDSAGMTALQWIPHSLGLVSFGGEPATVPDELISMLRKHVEEIALAGGEIFYGIKEGDVVKIYEGPFRGYDAIFRSEDPGERKGTCPCWIYWVHGVWFHLNWMLR